MKALYVSAIVALAIAFGQAGAFADDYNPPTWRGDDFTTYQKWEFSDDSNPAEPDEYVNPYVDPPNDPPNDDLFAFVEYDTPFTPWIDMDYGHQGVWYVEDWIELHIPNSPEPNARKDIWLQLTYYADGAGDAEIFTVPSSSSVEMIDKISVPGDDWYWYATFLITIEPNPVAETIYLLPRDCTIYIDEIVVDTICIPEPATATLLLLSAAAIMRRRR